jgi:hypothetical protein
MAVSDVVPLTRRETTTGTGDGAAGGIGAFSPPHVPQNSAAANVVTRLGTGAYRAMSGAHDVLRTRGVIGKNDNAG